MSRRFEKITVILTNNKSAPNGGGRGGKGNYPVTSRSQIRAADSGAPLYILDKLKKFKEY